MKISISECSGSPRSAAVRREDRQDRRHEVARVDAGRAEVVVQAVAELAGEVARDVEQVDGRVLGRDQAGELEGPLGERDDRDDGLAAGGGLPLGGRLLRRADRWSRRSRPGA